MEIIVAIGKGIGTLFLHPLFYIFLIISFYIGLKRVKREREMFHTRVYDTFDDLKSTLGAGLLAGLLLSSITITLGVNFTMPEIYFISSIYIIYLLLFRTKIISPILVLGTAVLFFAIIPHVHTNNTLIDGWLSHLTNVSFEQLIVLITMFFIIEGFLIIKSATKKSSPLFMGSTRGKVIGAHEASKLWLLPVAFLVPANDGIFSPAWLPIFSFGNETYAIVMFPFAIGFYQFIKGSLPQDAVLMAGIRVVFFGIVFIGAAVAAFFSPIFIPIIAVAAILTRQGLVLYERYIDEKKAHFFTNKPEGMIVLGVIPMSPAAQMGIRTGEIICKVNGRSVYRDDEFYEALQTNMAYCKLEVINEEGHMRFAQRALYHNEHHELGLLFVEENDKYDQNVAT